MSDLSTYFDIDSEEEIEKIEKAVDDWLQKEGRDDHELHVNISEITSEFESDLLENIKHAIQYASENYGDDILPLVLNELII